MLVKNVYFSHAFFELSLTFVSIVQISLRPLRSERQAIAPHCMVYDSLTLQ